MKSVNLNIRIQEEIRDAYKEVCKKQAQNSSELLRRFVQEKIKDYLVEEIQSVELPAEKALCDLGDLDIGPDVTVEVVFIDDYVEYNRSDNSSNEPVQFARDKWEDIFENYPEILKYALDI